MTTRLLLTLLNVAGNMLYRVYQRQMMKLMRATAVHLVPRIKAMGGERVPVQQLESALQQVPEPPFNRSLETEELSLAQALGTAEDDNE